MQNARVKAIIELCLSAEKLAEKLYSAISEKAGVPEHKAFWLEVALDELRHMNYWERLLLLAEKDALRNPFDDPARTESELRETNMAIEKMLEGEEDLRDPSKAILLAFRLESGMLHPAFPILFRALRKEIGDISPEDDYTEHINRFSTFVDAYLKKPELKIIAGLLSQLWNHSVDLATQFDEIRTLRGTIPICANCKNIRDDKGYWKKIEDYFSKYANADFTHSLCPDCVEKLYPQIAKKMRK
jgi:rubrerythrin